MQLLRNSLLRASRSPRIERLVRRSAAMRPLVGRFLPGEELPQAVAAAVRLRAGGVGAVLSYLGENVRDGTAADRGAAEYRAMLGEIARTGLDAQISVKLTQLGWDLDADGAKARLRQIVAAAAAAGIVVNIDMESSPYVDGTIAAFTDLLDQHRNVGLCLQAYLHRTEADLERLMPLRPRLRLVKGAYREPPAVALQSRPEVDARYLALSRRLLEASRGGAAASFGTHDLALIGRVRQAARDLDVHPPAYDIQMLYGIHTDALRRLAREGECARVFICYGSAWYPWFMRRLAERPANLLTVVRNIVP